MDVPAKDLGRDADVQEFHELLADSGARLKRKLRTALTVVAIFVLFAIATFLCTDKGPFHSYWSPYGLVADILAMVSLLPALMTSVFVWIEWSQGRSMRKDFNELMEDRYGVTQR